jgi:hypothetical protein
LGDGYPGEVEVLELPFAARCDDDKTARSAAFAGSSACSINDLSWPLDCMYVGDAFLGVDSKKSFFVENFRDKPPPDCAEEGVGAGGDIVFEAS